MMGVFFREGYLVFHEIISSFFAFADALRLFGSEAC